MPQCHVYSQGQLSADSSDSISWVPDTIFSNRLEKTENTQYSVNTWQMGTHAGQAGIQDFLKSSGSALLK